MRRIILLMVLSIVLNGMLTLAYGSQEGQPVGLAIMGWAQTYGGTNDDEAYSMVQTVDGGYAVAGSTASFGAGNYDFWLVKTDENGVVPEFPFAIILSFFVIVTLLAVILAKRRFLRKLN